MIWRFHGEVNTEDISRYFHLDDSDRNLTALHRGNRNRLGFAVQHCTVRYLGAFAEDLTETPATVVSILGRQLDIEDTTCFGEYCSSRQRWDHTARIRERGEYSDFFGQLDSVPTQSMALRSVLDRHRSARHVVRARHSMAHCAQGLVARGHRPGTPYFAASGASAGAIVVLFDPRCFYGSEAEAGGALGRSGWWSSIAG